MAKQQKYNIQFPFVKDEAGGALFKLSPTEIERVKSDLRHVLFTPVGQRIMDPEFGTDLIKYVFDQVDEELWDNYKGEITRKVQKYVPGVVINSIDVYADPDLGMEVYAKVVFTVSDGQLTQTNSFTTKL